VTEKREVLFETIGVIGVGLIGGSIGMAAKRRGLVRRVIGIGRNVQRLQRAKDLAAIDEFTLDMQAGVSGCDLVVVCTPVRSVVPIISQVAPALREGAIVTDVGSTKSEICRGAEKVIPPGRHFVGGHPMAGSEASGVDSAAPYLFLGATYVITPTESTNLGALRRVVDFAQGLGAEVALMKPEEHDRSAAVISHIPHILAAAILDLAAKEQSQSGKVFQLVAGSFRDLTRVASSPAELWRDICLSNREAICELLESYRTLLAAARDAIAAGDEAAVEGMFENARRLKEDYLGLREQDKENRKQK